MAVRSVFDPIAAPRLVLAACAGLAILGAGCGKQLDPPPPPPFKVSVKIDSDPNRPLTGAKVLHQDKEVGVTGPDGRALVQLKGNEGDIATLTIKCPETNQQPAPFQVGLRRLADQRVPEYAILCPPLVRRVVVGVRADNGANLPVVFLGSLVARTDSAGAAHFALDVKPGEQFEVQIKTDDQPKLKPQNPTRTFVMPPRDEVVLFSQTFALDKKKVFRGGPKKPTGPTQIGPAKL